MADREPNRNPDDEFGRALTAATNSDTNPTELAQIAASHPELRGLIAAHPQAYPGLLDWLSEHGDDEVRRIVAARRRNAVDASRNSQAVPPTDPRRGRRRRGFLLAASAVAVVLVVAGGIALASALGRDAPRSTTSSGHTSTVTDATYQDPQVRWRLGLKKLLDARETTGAENPEEWYIDSVFSADVSGTAIVSAMNDSGSVSGYMSAAIDQSTGQIRWAKSGVMCTERTAQALVCAEYSQVPTDTDKSEASPVLALLDPITGKSATRGTKLQPGDSVVVQGDDIYSGSCNSDTGTINASRYTPEGELVWRQQVQSPGSPAGRAGLAVSPAGLVVSCASMGSDWTDGGSGVFAQTDGHLIPTQGYHATGWLPNGQILAATPISEGAGHDTFGLTADGQLEWTLKDSIQYSRVHADQPILVQQQVDRDSNRLVRLAADTGTSAWKDSAALINVEMAAQDDDMVITRPGIGDDNPKSAVQALDTASGKLLWSVPWSGWTPAAATLAEPVVIVADDAGNLYGFNRKAGNQVWRIDTEGTSSSPTLVSARAGCLVQAGSEVLFVR